MGTPIRRMALALIAAAALCAGGDVWAEPAPHAIGYVKTAAGEASVLHDGTRTPASPGHPLFEKDILETGADGSLGVTLKDNAMMSLGHNSRLALESYLLEPEHESYSFVTRIARGTVQYVSGLIAKLSPESVEIKTPVATLGVRGTRLLVKVDGGAE